MLLITTLSKSTKKKNEKSMKNEVALTLFYSLGQEM